MGAVKREPNAAPRPVAASPLPEASFRGSALTPRAVIIGLLMSMVLIGLTQALSLYSSAAEVGGKAPPPAPIYLLFLYVVLLAPLLGRLNRRLALARGELLLIYAMMLVVGPITHPHAIGFLIPHAVSPLYYNAQEPGWSLFQETLPAWLGPRDPAAVKAFFQGGDGAVPWASWLLPMLAWSSLLIALFTVMLCVNVLLRRQWIEHERLAFPLAAIPLALTESGRGGIGQARGVLRQPLFWSGVILALALQAPGMIHRYFPQTPDLPLQDIALINPALISPPWTGLGTIRLDTIFWLIGVAYLLPKEISFSAWAFYGICLLENVAAVWLGRTGEMPNVYSNDFPALFSQGAGAAFALAFLTLWAARRHLARAFRAAKNPGSGPGSRDENLSYRAAFLGLALGVVFILGWLCLAGMRLWVAALFFALMLGSFFIFTRIRAEAGLGMGVILWPKMLNETMLTLVGAQYMKLSELTVLHALRWLYFGAATGSVMACQMEGFKLADAGGLRGRGVGRALLLAMAIAVPLAFAWTLATYYARGFEALPIGQRGPSLIASQVYWSYQNLVAAHAEASGPDWSGMLAMSAGAAVTMALHLLRMRYLWFPLHPVGYLAANSWGMHINWFSFFLGWLFNVLITRYGGLSVYRRLLPLFLGLIVGDMLHEGIWGLAARITGGAQ